MTEVDERTITAPSPAPRRFVGDTSVYSPDFSTPAGLHVGRSLRGRASTPTPHPGALQVFVPGAADLALVDSIISNHCDHAQIHPAILHRGALSTVGRGYWIRSDLDSLLYLVRGMLPTGGALRYVLMVPPPGVESSTWHGRIVVPFAGGVTGESILSPAQLSWLRTCISDHGARPVLEHLDFNGTHFGITDTERRIAEMISRVNGALETSHIRHSGPSMFISPVVNVESYPVVEF